MKKIFTIICILMILAAALPSRAAESFVITIMDSDIALSVPDGYDTITRDLDEHSDILEKYGASRENLLSTMRAENRYLEARNQKTGNELMVTSYMNKNSINLWSYAQKENTSITQSAASLKKSMQEGVDITVYDSPKGYKFFKYTYGLGDPQSIIYATVENGRNIELSAYTYNGTALQQEDMDALQYMVDSFDVLTKMVSRNYVEPPSPIVVVSLIAAAVIIIIVVCVIARKKSRERQAALAEKRAQMAFNSWRAADEWEEDERVRTEDQSSDRETQSKEEQDLQALEKRRNTFSRKNSSTGYVHRIPAKKQSHKNDKKAAATQSKASAKAGQGAVKPADQDDKK